MLSIDWSDLSQLTYSNTVKEIAQIKGCSITTVRRMLKKNHVERQLRGFAVTQATLDKIAKLYESNSTCKIAKLTGIPLSTVKKYVHLMGIQRTRSEATKLAFRKYCPHQFTIRTEDGYACLACKQSFLFD